MYTAVNFCFLKLTCMQELFARKFSSTAEQEREMEVEIVFEFLTKKEMAEEPISMTPSLAGQ